MEGEPVITISPHGMPGRNLMPPLRYHIHQVDHGKNHWPHGGNML